MKHKKLKYRKSSLHHQLKVIVIFSSINLAALEAVKYMGVRKKGAHKRGKWGIGKRVIEA